MSSSSQSLQFTDSESHERAPIKKVHIGHEPEIGQIQQEIEYDNKRIDQKQKNTVTAKDYYNQQLKNTETHRRISKLYYLRNFQNWVKAVLINEYSKKCNQNKLCFKLLNVFEMGCGKGGDMYKWSKAGTGLWFGIDISSESLKEAERRHKTQKEDKKKQIQKIYLMETKADSDSTLFRSRLPQDIYFDFVSMQFMANLLFSSEQAVENMFENMTCRLTNQGIVLMTITDSNVLVKKMREFTTKDIEGNYVYSRNQYFSIKFDSLQFSKNKPFGQQYYFYLEDSVGFKEDNQIKYVPEYLIELQAFEQKAKEYNLEIIENLNFIDFFEKYKQKHSDLLKIMVKPPSDEWKMPMDQWEIAHLYRVVVLRHLKGQAQPKIRRHPHLTELPDSVLELDNE
ncbi:unnamed protein product (macronuclear) [Paramecium tetraurelia]|uniref:mRNA cap guanine-N(7) methyltransferase n=1 Tax=Paramecium tetraurelia TaxID=5888 RepID=A0DKP8_PARTE|nr:uncharacterized protein GSPATT00017945001 [Paramecium tetraurelia]CAK83615.1 unnamed protein product [Paramecium tetraurelia]|eukprot:XP_001451012.1 hypothetical protein (macronuclear) [Paramecium tetraurelia strain d4-2]